MFPLTLLDAIALTWFCIVWIGYVVTVDQTAYGAAGLSAKADRYRYAWMQQMLVRDARIVDAQIMSSLQNGTAFFASTSLIAVGGSLNILRSSNELLDALAALPFGTATAPGAWEAKVIGLAFIFGYAFFKFTWSYRLFNYAAIMLGAAPPWQLKDTPQAQNHANRTAGLCEVAGRQFNRGQRALFFAIAYLGWFIGPWLFMIATTAVVGVQWRRHFASEPSRVISQ